ncbi:hypothetical protein [Nocardioides sp. T2.26MG-1]|uniref:hypothetical protein n=1 Tax=Nocardioides sp. T2.26MG-1 TaxID=3041166 RepID=UPI002540DCE7|nr:hypothetical protein [Nocardioides sp. T2.26MG-1]
MSTGDEEARAEPSPWELIVYICFVISAVVNLTDGDESGWRLYLHILMLVWGVGGLGVTCVRVWRAMV